jgi:two-component system, cell cycle sensor histidine kinase and response regulator CckA
VRNLQSELGIKIADGDYVVLAVKDSGMGIPAEIHEKIFEPFFTTKEQGKGTGLGLSTVTGIVKSHHGYLRVISELGKGAEFLVYLPAVKGSEMAASGVEKSVLPEGRGELVLVVDDEPAIIDVARDILVRHGYRVLTAGDGTEALSVVAQNQGKVNLVVTDIMMPFMDGVALVRSLRRLAPEIKVLACSGLASGASMSNKVEELRRLGVSPIMHKPFTAQRLLVNVRRALDNLPLEPEEIDSAGPRN